MTRRGPLALIPALFAAAKVAKSPNSVPFLTSPDALILAFLSERTQATVAAIQAACRLAPGEVRSRLAHLESLRHVASRTDQRLVPPGRVFLITAEGRRRMER